MEFSLEDINDEKELIYLMKKESVRPYVEKIWGWDEDYQIKDFNESYVASNFKLIQKENNIIGFTEINEFENYINITEIHLKPNYQGRGVGSKIIRKIVDQANNLSKTVIIGCFKENKGAIKLYKRIGFEVYRETDTHVIFKHV